MDDDESEGSSATSTDDTGESDATDSESETSDDGSESTTGSDDANCWEQSIADQKSVSPRDVAVDSLGNVYMVAWAEEGSFEHEPLGSWDIVLAKYSPAGALEWSRILGTDQYDVPAALSVDANDHLIVLGSTAGVIDGQSKTGGSDVIIYKFRPDAELVWNLQIGSDKNDVPQDVVTDSSGHIYFTGGTDGRWDNLPATKTKRDSIVVRVDADGRFNWAERIVAAETDFGAAIGVDRGAVYVAGATDSGIVTNEHGGYIDSYLGAFSATDGQRQWLTQWGERGLELAIDLAVDRHGDIYVASNYGGASDVASSEAVLLVKYDAQGQRQWEHYQFGDPLIFVAGMGIDSRGDIVVSGRAFLRSLTNARSPGDFFVAHYTPGGSLTDINVFGSEYPETAYGMAIDGADNIFITNSSKKPINGWVPDDWYASVFHYCP